jgi:cytochrome c oxidase subunit 2
VVNIFWFTLLCIGIFGFSFFYSAKRNKKPLYTHGTDRKHYIITAGIGVLVFLSVDMVITKISARDMREVYWKFPDASEDIVKIQVLAQQWVWNFRYAGADGEFNTGDDVVTLNDMRIPVGKKVMLEMTSKDVIHAFFFAPVRIKADAIPGRKAKLWFDTNKVGTYQIACAEMCGTHHYLMQAKITIMPQDDFDLWKNESEKIALTTNDQESLDLRWGWKWGSF